MKYELNEWGYKWMAVWMDGGSITLFLENQTKQELTITIQQHVMPEYYEELSSIPGRIYLNNEIVDKRSSTEKIILKYLNDYIIGKLEDSEKEILISRIRWVESSEYVELVPFKLTLSEARKKQLG